MIPDLKPGDCLLYKGVGFFSKLIFVKTWNQISHVEIYIGNGKSWASRDGKGVDEYPLRTDGLVEVMRPLQELDWDKGRYIFNTVYRGQKYDWVGLLRFAYFKSVPEIANNNAQFCSEFATRMYRVMGMKHLFNDADADAIAPFQFHLSESFVDVGAIANA